MRVRVQAYVGATAIASAAMIVALMQMAGAVNPATTRASVAFAVLGLVCQAAMFQMHRTAAGSTIAFIPFLTAAAVAPNWRTPLFIALAVAVVELLRRPQFIKGLFNVAQYALASSVAIAVYVALDGQSLHLDERFRLLPYGALFAVFLLTNTVTVSGVVAVDLGQGLFETWLRQNAGKFRFDIIASPLAYIFALAYNRFAFAGIIFLGLLLLGVRQLYRTNWTLEQTNRELLEVMVAAIELRDPYTSGHSQRVAEYSVTIARAIGLTRKQIDRVSIAALLHDVGKIDERFASILQKPGRLTDEERAIIELHPVISEELVSRVSGLADILPSVRHHHERWDGKGYPDQLSGEAIPLFARIITFADTIDAMTTDRPYRPALGPAEVRAELLRNRGKQFDPALCDRLLASPLFQDLFARLGAPRAKSNEAAGASVAA
jgi:HD-GYP domain-containing protein (c-di-GMP phosphodiesterase class II)